MSLWVHGPRRGAASAFVFTWFLSFGITGPLTGLARAQDAAPVSPPTAEEAPRQKALNRTDIQCELPEESPDGDSYRAATHLIFWDDTEKARKQDEYLNAVWSRQIEILKKKIMDQGVDEARIVTIALKSSKEFMETIRATCGPKRIYAFGHADALRLHVGRESIDVRKEFNGLVECEVSALTHYGCSFVRFEPAKKSLESKPETEKETEKEQTPEVSPHASEEGVGVITETPPVDSPPAQKDSAPAPKQPLICFYGHFNVSMADSDDSPKHLVNPILCAEIYTADELPDDAALARLNPEPPAFFHWRGFGLLGLLNNPLLSSDGDGALLDVNDPLGLNQDQPQPKVPWPRRAPR